MNANTDPQPERILVIILRTFRSLLSKDGILLWSVFLLLIVWGPKGVPLFTPWFQRWIDADPAQSGFRLQLLSFVSGVVLLVLIPVGIIHFVFKQKPQDYGLGLGDKRLGIRLILAASLIGIPLFYLGSLQPAMWSEYPMLYRGLTVAQIIERFSWQQFILYEILYASFFVVIEFSFRGYMLFGLADRFGLYSVLVQMLPYTMWHLPKPVPELISTPIWGFATAAVGLRARSIWYTVLIHWVLNVFLDTLILVHRGVITLPRFSN